MSLAAGSLLAPWEDDDISLPHRLELSRERLGERDYFNPRRYWYLDRHGLHWDHAMGVGHNLSLFRRRAWQAVGGYPVVTGSQDAEMDHLVHQPPPRLLPRRRRAAAGARLVSTSTAGARAPATCLASRTCRGFTIRWCSPRRDRAVHAATALAGRLPGRHGRRPGPSGAPGRISRSRPAIEHGRRTRPAPGRLRHHLQARSRLSLGHRPGRRLGLRLSLLSATSCRQDATAALTATRPRPALPGLDLADYISTPDGIFMHHVLEHDLRWRIILRNALTSFRRRMVLVVHTPFVRATAVHHRGVARPRATSRPRSTLAAGTSCGSSAGSRSGSKRISRPTRRLAASTSSI